MKISTVTLFTLALMPSVASSETVQQNSATRIDQEHYDNYISEKHINELNNNIYGSDDKSDIVIINIKNGTNNTIKSFQHNTTDDSNKNNSIAISTSGVNNKTSSFQYGYNNESFILVDGISNDAILVQLGINNNAIINQLGNNNEAHILQLGINNYDIIEQEGDNNKALIINKRINNLNGAGNQITQNGSGSPVYLINGMSRFNISIKQ